MSRAYDLIVFDLDGTLIDSRADLTAAVNHVLRAFGLVELSVDTVSTYIGEGARMLVQRALGVAHQQRVDEGLRVFMAYYGAHLLDCTRAYPGIPEALAAFSARGATLAVLSNKPEAMSRRILEGLGLLERFVAVVGGDSLSARKPDPIGLDHLRAVTNTPRERTLLVGDSSIDLHTARAGGVAFCGVTWGLRPDDLRAAAVERMVAVPSELLVVLDSD